MRLDILRKWRKINIKLLFNLIQALGSKFCQDLCCCYLLSKVVFFFLQTSWPVQNRQKKLKKKENIVWKDTSKNKNPIEIEIVIAHSCGVFQTYF